MARLMASPGEHGRGDVPDHCRELWSWAVKETASWQKPIHDRKTVYDRFGFYNATESTGFLLDISDGDVRIEPKPPGMSQAGSPVDSRIRMYRAYLEGVVNRYCPDIKTKIFVDVADARRRDDDVPVFVFQKPIGCREILLPDVDFFHFDFYTNNVSITDVTPYGEKECGAIFVGSTTGGEISEEIAKCAGLPRLRAERYFRGSSSVIFRLPNIVQCDTADAQRILEGMGIGGGENIPWQDQLRHKFIISMDGNGATCSRVVIALRSNSVLLKYDSIHELFYFSSLRPWIHYIPIHDDGDIEGLVEAEQRYPGIFSHITKAGQEFVNTYLTRQSVMQYTAWLLRLYEVGLSGRRHLAQDSHALSPCVDAGQPVAPNQAIGEVLCHIAGVGDRRFRPDAWVGLPCSGTWIEGIAFDPAPGVPRQAIQYQVCYMDGSMSDPAFGGEYVGSRGLSKPIAGLRLAVRAGRASIPLACAAEAVFTDGSHVRPAEPGRCLVSATGAPLEAFRVAFCPSYADANAPP